MKLVRATLLMAALTGACTSEPTSNQYQAAAGENVNRDEWTDVQRAMGIQQLPEGDDSAKAPPVAKLIDGLEKRVTNDPDDVDSWILLAQSYGFVGRLDEAHLAVSEAVVRGADEAALRRQVTQAHVSRFD